MKIINKDYNLVIEKLHNLSQQTENLDVKQRLEEMENEIRKTGDQALLKYTERFDKVKIKGFELRVRKEEVTKAYTKVSPQFIQAIKRAQKNLRRYYKHQLPQNWVIEETPGVKYGMKYQAIETIGVYVPGGRAPYPSTVLMNCIPAQIAKVSRIVMVTPPNAEGEIAPQILVAADIVGINEIYKVGGGQAIFALAYGTASIPKVDKIVGPGNIFVTLAKQMVFGRVGIDKTAGPSDVLVYIKDEKYLGLAAAEALAQLEHDPLSQAIIVSENHDLLLKLVEEIRKQKEERSRKEIIEQSLQNLFLILSKDEKETIEIINKYAPEHLVLIVEKAAKLVNKIKNAGAIFLGAYTPVTVGDYYAGPNHVLPTSGTARFSSPLGVMDFFKYSSIVEYTKSALRKANRDISELTKMEGFEAHQKAVDIRL